eukprot:TRINITY_DN6298_c0_g1_i1.p1 TRINITY_DN6298_c0_g1~~TRINITY_DN6298_c0_g1_i1.p1  ORF type:complete len:651 (+),score=155.40 TRINITY_DN6298_c0_g1_i1:106-1953(+)
MVHRRSDADEAAKPHPSSQLHPHSHSHKTGRHAAPTGAAELSGGSHHSDIEASDVLQRRTSRGGSQDRHVSLHTIALARKHMSSKPNERQELKEAFTEFYVLLDLLKNFKKLNHMAFSKILKKYDKCLKAKLMSSWIEKVEKSYFCTSKVVDHITHDTELLYAAFFERGDRSKAMSQLRVQKEESPPLWSTFFLGINLGICLAAMAIVVVSYHFGYLNQIENGEEMFTMFRGLAIPSVFLFMLGFNVFLWMKTKINYVLIFELDPRDHLSPQTFLAGSSFALFLWCGCTVLWAFADEVEFGDMQQYIPLGLFLVYIFVLVNPLPVLRSARVFMLVTLLRVLAAPFKSVHFKDLWLADQLGSLVTFLQDTHFLICFYVSGESCTSVKSGIRPFLAALPAWLRLMQCLRRYYDLRTNVHLLNGAKYTAAIFVVIFSSMASAEQENDGAKWTTMDTLWAISAVVATVFSCWWDIVKDWGLFTPNSNNKYLRNKLLFPKSVYYVAVVLNVWLRFMWVITLTNSNNLVSYLFDSPLAWATIAALFEISRRSMWNIFRLENEHLYNCDNFRAIREIPLPQPMAKEDEKDMDIDDLDDYIAHLRRNQRTSRSPKDSTASGPE